MTQSAWPSKVASRRGSGPSRFHLRPAGPSASSKAGSALVCLPEQPQGCASNRPLPALACARPQPSATPTVTRRRRPPHLFTVESRDAVKSMRCWGIAGSSRDSTPAQCCECAHDGSDNKRPSCHRKLRSTSPSCAARARRPPTHLGDILVPKHHRDLALLLAALRVVRVHAGVHAVPAVHAAGPQVDLSRRSSARCRPYYYSWHGARACRRPALIHPGRRANGPAGQWSSATVGRPLRPRGGR